MQLAYHWSSARPSLEGVLEPGVDHARPIPILFPGVRGAILDVLTRVETGLTIRQLAERAGVSHPQAARHVRDLETLGVIAREHVGRSHRITLTDSMTADLLRRLTRQRDEVIRQMRVAAAQLTPAPSAMVVFGSFARGDDHAGSDLDVLVVVDDGIPEGALDGPLAAWCDHIARLTGNTVTEIVVDRRGLDAMSPSLLASIDRDGIVILGERPRGRTGLRIAAEGRDVYDA
jgi:DNA-binding Lrp family transcriptional regulator